MKRSLVTPVINILKAHYGTTSIQGELPKAVKAVDFEVFGQVQGVYFRKHTKLEADKLGIKGWCMNTTQGSVLGHLQGGEDDIVKMMQWLKGTGSPASIIEKTEFKNMKEIPLYTFSEFGIRPTV